MLSGRVHHNDEIVGEWSARPMRLPKPDIDEWWWEAQCEGRLANGVLVRQPGESDRGLATRVRAYLIANSIVKAGGPYRDVYDARRAATADRVHGAPCVICGGSAKDADAAIGQPWRDGHKHADALRVTAKRVLRDLWRAARDYHGGVCVDEFELAERQATSAA